MASSITLYFENSHLSPMNLTHYYTVHPGHKDVSMEKNVNDEVKFRHKR
jgi:hypothetical protein